MPVDAAKFADRLANLTLIGQRAARDGSAAFQKQNGVSDAIEFVVGESFERLNRRYWDLVDQFKTENGFGPEAYITTAKVAALTIYCLLTHEESVFRSKIGDIPRDYIEYCYMSFCNLTMISLMELKNKAELGERRNMYYFIVRALETEAMRQCKPTLYALCLYTSAMLIGKTRSTMLG